MSMGSDGPHVPKEDEEGPSGALEREGSSVPSISAAAQEFY